MSTTPLNIGFIGLGIMGTPMALHLQSAGHTLFVQTRSSVPEGIRASAATVCPDAKTVAEHADIVFLMVPDTPDVQAVLFGPKGVAEGLRPGKTVVDMSSISPIDTKEFASRIEALGCDYLDAPVSGGQVGAKNATLSIMVGGKEEAFARVLPLLSLGSLADLLGIVEVNYMGALAVLGYGVVTSMRMRTLTPTGGANGG